MLNNFCRVIHSLYNYVEGRVDDLPLLSTQEYLKLVIHVLMFITYFFDGNISFTYSRIFSWFNSNVESHWLKISNNYSSKFCTNSPQSRTSLYLLSKFDDCSPPLLNIGRISQSYVTK